MKTKSTLKLISTAVLSTLLFANPVLAEKPEKGNGQGHGKNKSEQHDKHSRKDEPKAQGSAKVQVGGSSSTSISFSFGSGDARLVRDYYGGQAAKGKCPPGLAKKGNGCQPPGQAKQWQKGKALSRDLRYHDIPNELRIRLPIPPEGHKYVQLGADLLLIAVGTSVVVDAIQGIL